MSKQHLSIFAIVAVSLIMGIPALMAEAERPAESVQECEDIALCPEVANIGEFPHPVCGVDGVAGTALIYTTITTYQNGNQNKVVTERTWIGDLFTVDGGVPVATINDKTTITEDKSDKGNNVDKNKVKVTIDCLDGGKEVGVEVTITNTNK